MARTVKKFRRVLRNVNPVQNPGRFMWAILYASGAWPAALVPDGETDNTRAIQARLDSGRSVRLLANLHAHREIELPSEKEKYTD
jgi:hypothetical protein